MICWVASFFKFIILKVTVVKLPNILGGIRSDKGGELDCSEGFPESEDNSEMGGPWYLGVNFNMFDRPEQRPRDDKMVDVRSDPVAAA